jgi:hypothetical protein
MIEDKTIKWFVNPVIVKFPEKNNNVDEGSDNTKV